MGIIDQTTVEFEKQKDMLLRSIARAEKLITPMETIGEKETYTIQGFIAYSIPRSPLLFSERQRFRNILKGLSLGRTEKKQAIEYLINLKYELIRRNTVLGEVQ
jgi:hypothetical protein